MKKIIKLKEKQLEKNGLPGNLLYMQKDKYHFVDSFCNAMIINNNEPAEDSTFNLAFDVEKYFINFLEACKYSNNPPAILTVNAYTRFEDIEEALGKNYTYLDSNSNVAEVHDKNFFMNITAEKFEPVLESLLETRRDIFPAPNNIVVFIFNAEDTKLPSIERITTVSRSRNIFVTTLIADKQKFDELYMPEILEIVEANSKLIFNCNQNEILSVTLKPTGAKPKTIKFER